MKKITELTAELAAPAIEKQGCELWDVEYVKEGGTWYLRVLLDKEGGVDILDCEAISRELSDALDEVDPIEGSYTLEVGSAGAERSLKRPGDFERFMGSPVLVKLYRPQNGSKEFAGHLAGYNAETGNVTVTVGKEELTFVKKDVALVRLRVEF
ncbi:MAG: ribosome maturation factor RimP [Oscillibacter sp.]|nr:ribosome maturation factor RimP [Oscillibacter sp.]